MSVVSSPACAGSWDRPPPSLLQRHGYRVEADGGGSHRNVLGHPLFELPIWLDGATAGEGRLGREVLLGIRESSLCGYLSVRAEDDHFDGEWRDAAAAMTVSGFFRARHQALLAPLVSDRRFWERFEAVWQHYGEAMLLERALHDPARKFGRPEFDAVLDRSQPLEIPGDTVLAIKGCWSSAPTSQPSCVTSPRQPSCSTTSWTHLPTWRRAISPGWSEGSAAFVGNGRSAPRWSASSTRCTPRWRRSSTVR